MYVSSDLIMRHVFENDLITMLEAGRTEELTILEIIHLIQDFSKTQDELWSVMHENKAHKSSG